MNLTLERTQYASYGVFGRIKEIGVTLEHAFMGQDVRPNPALPLGTYTCKRGTHRLHDLKPFETFEVMDVPGHTGILFHVGNWNKDSNGCILLGIEREGDMIVASKMAFHKFMDLQHDVDTFLLEVKNHESS